MLKLRPYHKDDAAVIAGWLDSEEAMHKWSADRYRTFPLTADDINRYYDEAGNRFYPLTAFDENGLVGHLVVCSREENLSTLRFCYVIVDSARRGQGCGKAMLTLALRWAFDIVGADKVTLGVFESNEPARRCYASLGFLPDTPNRRTYRINGEDWLCLELALERPQ